MGEGVDKPVSQGHQVGISEQNYQTYKLYAAVKAITLEQAIAYALKDWMERVGQGHIESQLGEGEGMTFFIASVLSKCDSVTEVTRGVTTKQVQEITDGEAYQNKGPRTPSRAKFDH